MNKHSLSLPALGPGLTEALLGKKQSRPLEAGEGILDTPVRDWWWPLFKSLGFEYHHFWASVLHWRRLQNQGLLAPGPLKPHSTDETLVLLFCLVFLAESRGHVCLPGDRIPDFWKKHLESLEEESGLPLAAHHDQTRELEPLPLLASRPEAAFICLQDEDNFWFYTRQSLELEALVCSKLGRLIQAPDTLARAPEGRIDQEQELDGSQQRALARARGKRFFILTGGPGTGKTTLARLIIGNFIRDFRASGSGEPVIRICAPTGRAASRLGEAFSGTPERLAPDVRGPICSAAATSTTVHRLIQELSWLSAPSLAGPDLILVDETSMLDLRLMARLLELLPDRTSLILLGDHRQIPSVDSGAILGDLLHSSRTVPSGTGERHDESRFAWASFLTTCHRLDPKIKEATDLVQTGGSLFDHPELARTWSEDTVGTTGVFVAPWADWQKVWLRELEGRLNQPETAGRPGSGQPTAPTPLAAPEKTGNPSWQEWKNLGRRLRSLAPGKAFELFSSLAMLSPLRRGTLGTEKINRLLAKNLGFAPESGMPAGLPVMVLRNDPQLGVYNGDRGVIERSGAGYALFRAKPVAPEGGWPSMAAIPDWECSFAMTCHKSQGSEFQTVILLVPPGCGSSLSRELLYTGMTRTKERLVILTGPDPEAWNTAMGNETTRWSRIQDILVRGLTS